MKFYCNLLSTQSGPLPCPEDRIEYLCLFPNASRAIHLLLRVCSKHDRSVPSLRPIRTQLRSPYGLPPFRAILHSLSAHPALPVCKARPQDRRDKRIAELERETRRLRAKLEQTEAVIEIQKKASMLLGIPLKSPDDEGND